MKAIVPTPSIVLALSHLLYKGDENSRWEEEYRLNINGEEMTIDIVNQSDIIESDIDATRTPMYIAKRVCKAINRKREEDKVEGRIAPDKYLIALIKAMIEAFPEED